MTENIVLNWKEAMAFSATIDGYEVNVDAHSEHGGTANGPRPKPLLLVALAGCTAMDVVSILTKMKVPFTDVKVEVTAEQSETHPKVYTSFHLIYKVFGKDISKEKVERAVELSQNQYCGVNAMLKKASEITYEIQLLD